jgi:hypothetical protein
MLVWLQFDAAAGPDLVRLVVDRTAEMLAGAQELPINKTTMLPDIQIGLVARVAELLKAGGRGRMIQLHGMAGAGKTTLAKAVFNTLHEQDRTVPCHLARLNPEMSYDDVVHERRALMEELAPSFGAGGEQKLEERLRGKRVLLVVDNVWEYQLKWLLPCNIMEVLGEGSVVLVTSRESWGTELYGGARWVQVVEASLLSDAESLQLLCIHAYGRASCPTEDEEPIDAIVERCEGLPLALEVVGMYLRATRDVWSFFYRMEDALAFVYSHQRACRLERQQTVADALDVSWQALGGAEQSTLLDIVWFMHGQPLQLVESFCDGEVLARLNRLGLVQWVADEEGEQHVTVHSVVVDFCKMLTTGDHETRLELVGSADPRCDVKRVLSMVRSYLSACVLAGHTCVHPPYSLLLALGRRRQGAVAAGLAAGRWRRRRAVRIQCADQHQGPATGG